MFHCMMAMVWWNILIGLSWILLHADTRNMRYDSAPSIHAQTGQPSSKYNNFTYDSQKHSYFFFSSLYFKYTEDQLTNSYFAGFA